VAAGGEVGVFAGGFEKRGAFCGVFCSENVVRCVVNVDNGWTLKRRRKTGQFLNFIFTGDPRALAFVY
jgi:hypothetical protein